MILQEYNLIDFTHHYHASCALSIEPSVVEFSYYIPFPNDESIEHPPKDCSKLYEYTCFELFIKEANTTKYLEVNLSKDSQLNFYQFSDYRKACEANIYPKLQTSEWHYSDKGTISFTGKIEGLDIKDHAIHPAIVLKTNMDCYYFATKHLANKPDFHLL